MKFKAAIFDLDGTLACTLPDLHASMNKMLETVGFPTVSLEELRQNANYCVREYIMHCLPEYVRGDDATVDRCLEIYTDIYVEHYCDNTYIYDGLLEVVLKMKEAGMWLAVHTNKNHEHACGMVEKLFPAGTFEMILGDGHCTPKPDPEGTRLIVKTAGLTEKDFCFIGDSDIDIKTADNADVFSIGVSWGYKGREVLETLGTKAIADVPADILTVIGIE